MNFAFLRLLLMTTFLSCYGNEVCYVYYQCVVEEGLNNKNVDQILDFQFKRIILKRLFNLLATYGIADRLAILLNIINEF